MAVNGQATARKVSAAERKALAACGQAKEKVAKLAGQLKVARQELTDARAVLALAKGGGTG